MTRPSSDTYATRDTSSGELVSSYCCSTYRVADPISSLGTFSSSSIGGPVFHPIADCEHPLLCQPGPGIASQETAISGSFQQNLAGVCNGVSVWRLIMGWIPGCGSLQMVHPFVSAPNFVSVTPSMSSFFMWVLCTDCGFKGYYSGFLVDKESGQNSQVALQSIHTQQQHHIC